MRPFFALFPNAHAATLAGNFWPRPDPAPYGGRSIIYTTGPETAVRVEESRPQGQPRGEVLLLHGLEGSSRSGYMLSMAHRLVGAGFVAHRMNLRSCGGTEALAPTLYHSGLTQDARAVLEQLQSAGRGPLFVVGYSLGGNVALKLAGELGAERSELVRACCAVSTPIDLQECVRALERRENWIYQRRFVQRLKQRYQRWLALKPGRGALAGVDRVGTIHAFDDCCTARVFGFGNAVNYYRTQSALRFLATIRVPALMVQAQDDPLIPYELFTRVEVRSNPAIELVATRHGGHLGFIARRGERFWADETLVEWLARRAEP